MNYFIKVFGHDNRHREYGWAFNQWLYE
jgi:hypothetical protein